MGPRAPAHARAPEVDVADQRGAALPAVATAYHGNTYRPLREFGDQRSASIAYVDRNTIAAHLERPLPTTEWATGNDQFGAPAFDDHVDEPARFRTDWIATLLTRTGVPGHIDAAGGAQRTTNRTNLGEAASRSDHDCAAQPGSEIGW